MDRRNQLELIHLVYLYLERAMNFILWKDTKVIKLLASDSSFSKKKFSKIDRCGVLEAEIIDGQGADNFSIGQILRDFRIKLIRF